ncbi:MAG: dihydroorotase [Planctomycetota bacterium]
MPRILITNGTVIDPAAGMPREADVLIRDGRIAAVGHDLGQADETIDAAGCWVTPGLIDPHVHFREPGDEAEETIASGAASAVAGGFTTVACMPNTTPPLDDEASIEFVLRESARVGLANVLPVGCLTKGRAGKELAEIGGMHARGAVAFTDDGAGVADAGVMRRALQYCGMFDALVMQHCEEPSLSGGCVHGGAVAAELGLPGIPAEAEELMLARDVVLNTRIGCRYHVQHISTAGAVELVRRAKADGLRVTAEASPHHLLLTDESIRSFDANYKMNPPLRTADDVAAVVRGVVDGTIDCLATDHAPHLAEEKNAPLAEAAFGILGLECAFPLYKQALFDAGHIDATRLIEMMTVQPARLLGIDRGTLAVGAMADVTIIDPERQWTIDPERFASKSRNCPFADWNVIGRPTTTIVDGVIKFRL